jgi:dolichyl-phosphate beta-glucosyltransferase
VNPLFLVAEEFRQHLQQYPDVSVIIPAYNEQDRILPTLERYKYYLRRHEERWNVKCFIYVVDDGSTDQSKEVIRKVSHASTSTPAVFCISLEENRGKGTALATGMQTVLQHHNHDDNDVPMLILTADADGSAEMADLEVLYKTMMQLLSHQQSSFDLNTSIDWNQPAIICGYRTYNQHVNDDDDAKISGRLVFRWGFRMIVRSFCGDLGTRDSQCGFKLLTLPAAALLYSNLHLQKWSHDVEVLYRAKLWNVPVAEAPVRWQDKTGSKLTAEGVVKVAARMFYDVLICRLNYDLGNWK